MEPPPSDKPIKSTKAYNPQHCSNMNKLQNVVNYLKADFAMRCGEIKHPLVTQ